MTASERKLESPVIVATTSNQFFAGAIANRRRSYRGVHEERNTTVIGWPTRGRLSPTSIQYLPFAEAAGVRHSADAVIKAATSGARTYQE